MLKIKLMELLDELEKKIQHIEDDDGLTPQQKRDQIEELFRDIQEIIDREDIIN